MFRLIARSLKHTDIMEFNDLDLLCENNRNMTSIEEYLTNVLVKFKINKSRFSAADRISLRKRFSHLIQQCHRRNAAKNVISLVMQLADHAYKLPECMLYKKKPL